MTREKHTAAVTFAMPALTDEALSMLAAFVAKLPRRALDGDTLNAMQRAREAGLMPVEVLPAFPSRGGVLAEVSEERDRQIAKWGDGVPSGGFGWPVGLDDLGKREIAKERCERAAQQGRCTMRDVLEEEVAEALAERPGSARQRAELVQVAAVAVKWIEAIDARTADEERRSREQDPSNDGSPCGCGAKGRGLGGFHYSGAPGCQHGLAPKAPVQREREACPEYELWPRGS